MFDITMSIPFVSKPMSICSFTFKLIRNFFIWKISTDEKSHKKIPTNLSKINTQIHWRDKIHFHSKRDQSRIYFRQTSADIQPYFDICPAFPFRAFANTVSLTPNARLVWGVFGPLPLSVCHIRDLYRETPL